MAADHPFTCDASANQPGDTAATLQAEIYRFSQAIMRDPYLANMILESMGERGCPTQHPTSTPDTDVDSFGPLDPPAPGSDVDEVLQKIKGILRNVGSVLNERLPHKKFRLTLNPGLGSLATGKWDTRQMVVAWEVASSVAEAVLGKNPRNVVPPDEIMNGCLLRGVVKILVHFPNSKISEGSGVLIDDFTIATVGHVIINGDDYAQGVGAWVGQGSGDDGTEYREGAYVAVHYEWFDKSSRLNDLAFIRLSEPFKTVSPIKYRQTPVTANGIRARIYGFPEDMPDDDTRGNRLCVSESLVSHMVAGILEHEGDTKEGTSGGPVIDVTDESMIAVHWGYGGRGPGGKSVNEAVAIDRYGNDFQAFLLTLDYMSGKRKDSKIKMLGEVEGLGGRVFGWRS